MDKISILNFIKSLLPKIQAQVAKQLKIQGSENHTLNLNVNLHTGDIYNVTVPAEMNLTKLASAEITPKRASIIQQKALEDLIAKHPQFELLSERDFTKAVVDSTLASMVAGVSDQGTDSY